MNLHIPHGNSHREFNKDWAINQKVQSQCKPNLRWNRQAGSAYTVSSTRTETAAALLREGERSQIGLSGLGGGIGYSEGIKTCPKTPPSFLPSAPLHHLVLYSALLVGWYRPSCWCCLLMPCDNVLYMFVTSSTSSAAIATTFYHAQDWVNSTILQICT